MHFLNSFLFYLKICFVFIFILPYVSWADSFYSLAKKGKEAYIKQNYDSAVTLWEKAKIKSPARDDISFNLAHAYYKNAQYEQASKLYQEGIQYGDTSLFSLYHYNLGNSHFKKAEQILLQGQQGKEQETVTKAMEYYNKSLESYRQSYKLDSNYSSTYKNMTLSYNRLEKLKQFKKEQEKKEQQQKKNPPSNYAKSQFKKAMALVTQNHYIKAEAVLREVIIKDPTAQSYTPYHKRIKKISSISLHLSK